VLEMHLDFAKKKKKLLDLPLILKNLVIARKESALFELLTIPS